MNWVNETEELVILVFISNNNENDNDNNSTTTKINWFKRHNIKK